MSQKIVPRRAVQFLPLSCLIILCSTPSVPLEAATGVATVGQQVTLSVTANGTAPFSYQWAKNSIDIAGANRASYFFSSARIADSGVYSCRISNSAGTVSSDIATLLVNPLISLPPTTSSAPRITSQPVSQTLTAGATVMLTVIATGSPTYQWRKNGVPIPGATSASYRLSALSALHNGTYSVMVTNSSGSVASNAAQLTITPSVRWSTIGADFNRDGYSDFLWQNKTTTEAQIELMGGTAETAPVLLGTVAANWEMRAVCDFNGDGSPDILWQNTATGEGCIWRMTGTAHTGTINLTTVTTDWEMVGAADLNGDEWADIVWQNKVTNEGRVWLMAGNVMMGAVPLDTLSAEWQIRGTGDFNGDHKADLLVQSKTTGESRIWLMSGATRSSSVSLGFINFTEVKDWVPHGSVDLNRDGKSDLVWQNVRTGETRVWLMNGTVSSSVASLGMMPTEWIFRN